MEYWERIRALREDKDITQRNLHTIFILPKILIHTVSKRKREIPISVR